VVAVLLTMIAGGHLFAMLGKNPFEVIRTIFWDPLFGQFAGYLRGQLLVKAGPLILIAIGLALGFRAGIWNIGAEGQYIIGAICGAAVGWRSIRPKAGWIFPADGDRRGLSAAGLWAMIPAILKTRFNTNEILVSLMLVYVAETILAKASTGFLKNPEGMGFPGSRNLSTLSRAANPELIAGTGMHWGGRRGAGHGDRWPGSCCAAYPGLPDPAGRAGAARGPLARGQPQPAGHVVHGASRARWPAWRACSRSRARPARSPSTSTPATASPRSSWPSSAGSTPGHRAGGLPDGADLCRRRDGRTNLGLPDAAIQVFQGMLLFFLLASTC
jgi:hypothetical protein